MPDKSDTTPKGSTSPLDNLSTSLDEDAVPNTLDALLASIPIGPGVEAFIDYPASSQDGEGQVVSARVPLHWLEIIDRLREMPGTNLPDIWPKRSNFVRWSIMQGIMIVTATAKELDADGRLERPLDPMIRAQISTEKIGGALEAKARLINHIAAQVSEIAAATNTLIALDEEIEAANLINTWNEEAQEQETPHWRDVWLKSLIREPDLHASLATLINNGHLVDERFIDMCIQQGIIEGRPDDLLDQGALE